MAGNYQTLIVDATISRLIRFHRGYYVLVFGKRPCHSFFEFSSGATSSYDTMLDQSIRRYPFSIVVLSRILFQYSVWTIVEYLRSLNMPFPITATPLRSTLTLDNCAIASYKRYYAHIKCVVDKINTDSRSMERRTS